MKRSGTRRVGSTRGATTTGTGHTCQQPGQAPASRPGRLAGTITRLTGRCCNTWKISPTASEPEVEIVSMSSVCTLTRHDHLIQVDQAGHRHVDVFGTLQSRAATLPSGRRV